MTKRVHLIISGRVQGVGYRMYAMAEARGRGLTGWVRNMPDGNVEAVVEGEESTVAGFLEWCRQGPPAAIVRDVKAEYSESAGEFTSFSVRHGR